MAKLAQSKEEFTRSFLGVNPADYAPAHGAAGAEEAPGSGGPVAAKSGATRQLPGIAFSLQPDAKTIAILAVLDDQIVKKNGKVMLGGKTVDAGEFRKKSQAGLTAELNHIKGAVAETLKLSNNVQATIWQSFRQKDPKAGIQKVASAAQAAADLGLGEAGKGNLLPAYGHLVKAAGLAANANHLLTAATDAAAGQADAIVASLNTAQTAGMLAGMALGMVVTLPVSIGLGAAATIAAAEGKVIAGEEFNWKETSAEIVVDALLSKFGARLEHEIVEYEIGFAKAGVKAYLAKHSIAATDKELAEAIESVMGHVISKAYATAITKSTEAAVKAALASYFKPKEHKDGKAKLDDSKAAFMGDAKKRLSGANKDLEQLVLAHMLAMKQPAGAGGPASRAIPNQ